MAVRKCVLEQLEERRLLSINLICKNLELAIGDIGKVTGVYKCVNGSPTGANLLANPWCEPFAYVKVGSSATQTRPWAKRHLTPCLGCRGFPLLSVASERETASAPSNAV